MGAVVTPAARLLPGAAILPAVLVLVVLVAFPAAVAAQSTESPGGADAAGLEGIAAGTHYVMIVPDTGGFRVAETMELRNTSAVTVDTLILPLFSGSWDVQPLAGFDGISVNVAAGALEVQRALAPGEAASFTVAYRLMAADLPLALTRAVAYPTDRLVILAPVDAPFTVLAGGAGLEGLGTFSGQEVRIYDAGAVAPVREWVLGLAPVGTPPWRGADVTVVDANRSQQGAWRPVVLGFALMALWALGLQAAAAVRLRGLRLPRVEVWMEAAEALEPAERMRLAEQVAAAAADLERAHRSRRLSESVYRRQKEALLTAWKHLHPDGGGGGS